MSNSTTMNASSRTSEQPVIHRKWFWISILANILLLAIAGGAILFAFMLSYDLQDARLQAEKETRTRQRAEQYLQESRARLADVQREVQRLNQLMSVRAADPEQHDSGKPELPVMLHFRKSFWGKGLVAVFENTSNQYLTLVLSVRNPTLATAKRFTIQLKGEDDLDFGHDDGWQFASGDEVSIYHSNYKSLKAVVP
ncbi:MAG: hypothetical protein HXY27_06985 [Hydrogenophilaceae bacterium]|nr:hypothetical protein [Hydrogenophilaceae bacterium]